MTEFEQFVFSQASPTIVYDLPKLRKTARYLQASAANANGQACFAVKANRHARILSEISQLGLGADIASWQELELAQIAGFPAVMATSPGLDRHTISVIDQRGGIVFFDHLQQMDMAKEAGIGLDRHGIRLMMPGIYSNFGIDMSTELPELTKRFNFKPRKIHVHCGEIESIGLLQQRLALIESMISNLRIEVIDLGGGFGVLSNHPALIEEAFDLLGQFAHKHKVRLLFEFGKVMVARCGFLVCTVIARKLRGNTQVLIMDTSSFNLGTWEARPLWRSNIEITGKIPTRIIGPSCYEGDQFSPVAVAPPLPVGSKIIFALCGAYTSSISSTLHALPIPKEVCFDP